jgi:hypothetical protein
MKRARVKEAALAVLIREGFDSETAKRLADLIAHEPIYPQVRKLDTLEKAVAHVTESH